MKLKPNLFSDIPESLQQQIWGYLDQQLEQDFDYVKIVVFDWHIQDFEAQSFANIKPLFWVTRQGDDPFAPLVEHEINWIKKYLGQTEAEVIVADFGGADCRAAMLYLVDDSDTRVELTVFTVDSDDAI